MITLAPGVIVDINTFFFTLKFLLLILILLYFIFSLIVVRQVNLMTKSLMTEVCPVLSMFAIAYSVISLAAVLLFVKLF